MPLHAQECIGPSARAKLVHSPVVRSQIRTATAFTGPVWPVRERRKAGLGRSGGRSSAASRG